MLSFSVWPIWIDRLDLLVATLLGLLVGTWIVVRRRRRIGIGPAPDRATSYSRVLRRQRLAVLLLGIVWLACLAVRATGSGIVLSTPDPLDIASGLRGTDAALLALPLAPLVLQLGALLTQTAALPSTRAADRASWRGAASPGQIAPVFWATVLTGVLWITSLVMLAIDLGGSCGADAPCVSVVTPVVAQLAVVSAITLCGALVLFLAVLLALRRTFGAHGAATDDASIVRSATADVVTRSTTDAILLSLGASAVLVGAATTGGFDFAWVASGSFGWAGSGPVAGEPMPYVSADGASPFGTRPPGLDVFGWIVRGVGALFVAWAWARIVLHTVRR